MQDLSEGEVPHHVQPWWQLPEQKKWSIQHMQAPEKDVIRIGKDLSLIIWFLFSPYNFFVLSMEPSINFIILCITLVIPEDCNLYVIRNKLVE